MSDVSSDVNAAFLMTVLDVVSKKSRLAHPNTHEEKLVIAAPPDVLEEFIRQAKGRGILRGGKGDWTRFVSDLRASGQIPANLIDELSVHLRLLADFYLVRRLSEKNLPKFRQMGQAIDDKRNLAVKNALEFVKYLECSDGETTVGDDDRQALLVAIGNAVAGIEKTRLRDAHVNSGGRGKDTHHSQRALANTFEALWNLYSLKPMKGNSKAYELARRYFVFAGCRPETKDETAEHADIRGVFKEARKVAKQVGPLTTVRRLNANELGDLKQILF